MRQAEKGREGVTMATILDTAAEQEYLALVHAFPLVSIRNDTHLDAAVAVIDRLLDHQPHSLAQEEYLGALTDLVEIYESAHVVIPATTGVEALRYLMDEHGLTQAELVSLFGAPSIVSEVLSGKRRLALSHITRLAERFGVPADVFIR